MLIPLLGKYAIVRLSDCLVMTGWVGGMGDVGEIGAQDSRFFQGVPLNCVGRRVDIMYELLVRQVYLYCGALMMRVDESGSSSAPCKPND